MKTTHGHLSRLRWVSAAALGGLLGLVVLVSVVVTAGI